MTKQTASLIALLCLCSANMALWAAETLETITITESATDTEITTGEVEHSEFTGVFKSINKEQLTRRDVALSDLLSYEAGVQTRQVGGLGSFASISIRAANSDQTAIYLDGIKLNSASQSSIDLSALELLNVDAVDIYRGSSPLQLGYGSIGGAVNIKALRTNSEASTRLLLGTGSFSTRRLQASHQSKVGRWDVIAAAGQLNSENDYRFVDNNGTPLNALDDQREPRHNAAVDQTGALFRTAYRWNSDSSTKLLLQLSQKDLGVPEWRNSAVNQASYAVDEQQLHLTHSINNLGDWNSNFTLFQHNNDNLFDDRLGQVTLGGRFSFSDSVVRGGKLYAERISARGTLGLTAEFRQETLSSTDGIFNPQNYSVTRNATSAAWQYAWFNQSGKLLITPLLHYQSNQDDYSGISRQNQNTYQSQVFSPQLGAKLEISNNLSLRANIARNHREPAFHELFGSTGLVRGNQDLKAEQGINADIGFSYKAQSDWRLEATAFASDRTDLITRVTDPLGVSYTVNTDRARVFGIELEHQWQASKMLDTEVKLTWQDARNIDDSPALNNKLLPGEAAWSGYARVAYRQAKYRLWAETEFKTDRFYDQANLLPAKDSHLQNIGMDWYWKNTQTSFAINNVGNDLVEDFNGFPRPGRAFFLTTSFSF